MSVQYAFRICNFQLMYLLRSTPEFHVLACLSGLFGIRFFTIASVVCGSLKIVDSPHPVHFARILHNNIHPDVSKCLNFW